jgi:hypothetical protein
VSEQQLLDLILQELEQSESQSQHDPEWTIFASAASGQSSIEHDFGDRVAAASPVKLNPRCDRESCWIESVENGWLFLLPAGEGNAWLLSVGGPAESLLSTSHLILDQIADLGTSRGTFLSHPRVAMPLSQAGWLACGTAALGFDPLCGDGTGNAIREAILASAVVRSAINKVDVDTLVAHYQKRLLAGLHRHLALCLDFYRQGHNSLWWKKQVTDLEKGLAWCEQELSGTTSFQYRLNGFTLERVPGW